MSKETDLIIREPEVIKKSVKLQLGKAASDQIESYCKRQKLTFEYFISKAAEMTIAKPDYQKFLNGSGDPN